MSKHKTQVIAGLLSAGISRDDAEALRRISMTLNRWFELECGNADGGAIEREGQWAIERAAWPASDKKRWLGWSGGAAWVHRVDRATYDSNDTAAWVKQYGPFPADGAWRDTGSKPFWTYDLGQNGKRGRLPIADRERGAEKRLAAIMARYPTLRAYIQGDCRGASLYILRPGDLADGADIDANYSRGIAVFK